MMACKTILTNTTEWTATHNDSRNGCCWRMKLPRISTVGVSTRSAELDWMRSVCLSVAMPAVLVSHNLNIHNNPCSIIQ